MNRIVFLGHATVLIERDGTRLLTDPLLVERVWHLRRRVAPVDRALAGGLSGVLISHLHQDHLDLASLRLLGSATPLLVPIGAQAWLRRQGFTAVRELDVGEVDAVGGVEVAAVEAHHDARRLGGPNAPAIGFLLRGSPSVYFAGDTEIFDGMARIGSQLDVALVPVSGWGTRLGPGHMDPRQAAEAVSLLAPLLAIPIHWGTYTPIGSARHRREQFNDPPHEFARHVARLAPGVEVRVLAPGESTEL